jgi:hypothetical protein
VRVGMSSASFSGRRRPSARPRLQARLAVEDRPSPIESTSMKEVHA